MKGSVLPGSVMAILPGSVAAAMAYPSGSVAVPVTSAAPDVAWVSSTVDLPTPSTTARSSMLCATPGARSRAVADVHLAGIEVHVFPVGQFSVVALVRIS